ncbi:cytochrome P450 [Mycena rosella]|uniref:Cytochrome P450 n=1 Tax=Mycena rosella TaxID=1033263 RepID=A0AAD7GVL7_MYCRO|nr:cytochrome P450 [Mycena rosella]
MLNTVLNTLLAGTGLYVVRSLYSIYVSGKRQHGLPPGPPTLPFIGNLHIFPREHLHLKFTEWAKNYGDIYSLKVMHLTFIVLNTPTAVKEVIDKRGGTSCNRPASVVADIITPDNLNLASGRYANDTWKALRKAAMHMLRPENMDTFKPFQRAEAAQLMWEMSTSPETFWEDIARFTTSFFMSVVYGIRAPRASSYAARAFTEYQTAFLACMEVGRAPPVDLFPILNVIPRRFSGWKKRAHIVSKQQDELFGYLLDNVKYRVARGDNNGAFMEDMYTHAEEWGLSPLLLLHLGGVLLQGSDTSSAIMQDFILLLSAHPEVQKRAQAEMDSVVGFNDPPTWEDLGRLPYLQAFLEECLRFRPIGPLALPHAMAEDDTYDGMFFPKDAIVVPNLWAIMHDDRYYEEPEKFMPERFLKHPLGVRPDIEDDAARRDTLIFGGGRRVCPGSYTGRAGLEISLANFIWAFDFSPACKPSGEVVTPDLWAYTNGLTLAPLPFKTTITVRSEKRDIIRRHFLEQTSLFTPFEQDLEPHDAEYVKRTRESMGL